MLHAREITLGAIVLRIIMAEVLGGVIGSERGRMNRPAGMRTYMLVSIGSCSFRGECLAMYEDRCWPGAYRDF